MAKNQKRNRGNNNNGGSKPHNRNSRRDNNKPQEYDRGKSDKYTGKGAYGAECNSPHSNDISWWNRSELYKDATRVPFNRLTGGVYDLSTLYGGTGYTANTIGNYTSLPSVMAFTFVPHVGYSDGVNSPLNRAFTSVYAGIYSKTTGAMQFTQASLSIITLALDSIVCNIGAVKRALAISHIWVGEDLNYPRVMLTACGFDPDTIIGHQDEVRQRLNNCIRNLNAMRAVQLFSTTPRHYQLSTNVYLDEARLGAQAYIFRPQGYYTFTEAGESEAFESEGLTYHDFQTDMDVLDFIDKIDAQLSAVRHSSAFALVSGSVQRAYPDADLLQVEVINGEEIINPVFDRNMLWQINNMSFVSDIQAGSLHVYENVAMDYIVAIPKSRVGDSGSINKADEFFINSYDGDTSDEFVMEATRLKVRYEEISSEWIIRDFGTELITGAIIYTPWGANTIGEFAIGEDSWDTQTIVIKDDNQVLRLIGDISRFRNAPYYYLGLDGVAGVTLPVGEVNVWTTVDKQALRGLNEAALLSAYDPSMYVVKI